MAPARDSITRNVAWYAVGNAIAKPAWFLFLTAGCMRMLGPQDYGVFTLSLALAGTVLVLSDLGAMEFMVREVARRPNEMGRYFSNLAVGRIVLSILAGVLAIGLGRALGYGPQALRALVAAALFVAAFRGIEFCRGVFRAFEVLRFEATSVLLEKGLVIIGGLVGLTLSRTAEGVLIGMGLGALLTLALTVRVVHRQFAPLSLSHVDAGFLLSTHRAALPIGAFSISTLALLSFAPVAIESFRDAMAVGTYGAAYRVIEASLLLPSAFAAATLPRLAMLHHGRDRTGFRHLLTRATASLLALSILAAAALWLTAPAMIALLGGPDYAPAGPLLRWLALALPPMAMTSLLAQALISSDDHWVAAAIVAAAALLNAGLCWTMTGPYGLIAPVLSLILCHVLIAGACAIRLLMSHR